MRPDDSGLRAMPCRAARDPVEVVFLTPAWAKKQQAAQMPHNNCFIKACVNYYIFSSLK